jgi:perosamine synthetase
VKKIPINKPSITQLEIDYVTDAITNGWGDKCYDYIHCLQDKFSHYLGTDFSLATSSCTGAIHLALMALGVKTGDEVIVPDITWIASVEPVLYTGAKPVFVDVLNDTWCIDPDKIRQSITEKTKAIIVVHLYGNTCEMDSILKIAKEHNIKIIEDAAEGLGSEYKSKKVGGIGDVGVFSFHGTKTMTTGEGGILVTNNEAIFEQAKILNDHGRNSKDPENKMFWMRNYGYKYKMSNLQAALGCAQIERIEELIEKKREIFNWYKESLNALPCDLNPEHEETKNSYWLPTAVFHKSIEFKRENFFSLCKEKNIDSRPFFFPLSSLPMFVAKPENEVAYDLYERAINLPSYHDMTKGDVKYVCDVLKFFLKK